MDYEVKYQDSIPVGIRFEPNPANSDGVCNHRLLDAAMSRFCPKGWSWNGRYLNTKLNLNQLEGTIDNVVERAQTEVTNVMDKLDEFQDFLHVIKEYNAQSNPK